MKRLLETLVRWRTAILGALFAAAAALPSLLGAPEVLAVVPAEYRPYVIAAGYILIWLTRPRAAVLPNDPEVDMRRDRLGKRR
ncbi:hypothetical protein [Devosia sp.]|uniref:hypothetical protein n=1 Tax=Devosia sp. TaxID=1871048 RepID=UPI001AC3FD74|nr:hypothetical protein [Devosia sp.]MBN9335786.1 hypothetical protein [Devosia sp.]